MTKRIFCWTIIILFMFSLVSLVSCIGTSQTVQSDFYNAGDSDLIVTGVQFDQYTLFSFTTNTSRHTLTLPSAKDIVANLSSPYAGEVILFAVTADGNNPVTLLGSTNVTVKPSALTIPGNSTLTMYCELGSVTSGSETVTIY